MADDDLVTALSLSTDDQQRVGRLTGRLQSIAELLSDAVDAVKDTDFPRVLSELTPWWLSATGDALARSAPPVKFVAELLKAATEIRDPERLAYLACTTAAQRAAELAFHAVGRPAAPRFGAAALPDLDDVLAPRRASARASSRERETAAPTAATPTAGAPMATTAAEAASETSPEAAAAALTQSIPLKELSLATLSASPFFRDAARLVDAAADRAGYDEPQRRRLAREFEMRVPGEVKRLLTHPDTRDRFASLADWLRFDNVEARVHDAWATHADYQRRLFEESPVFGEEPFPLSAVYADTECGLLTWGEIRGDGGAPKSPFDERHGGRHDLLTTVMTLIGDDAFDDAIIVQGTAGAGKSSFTLRLATELLREGLSPIRIRFRDIGVTRRNIEDALPDAVRFWDEHERATQTPLARPEELFLNGRLFDQPPVRFGQTHISPYVLILDGWDEISVSSERGFFEQMDYLLGQVRDRFLNRSSGRVRVVVTGRPGDAIAESRLLRPRTRVLTIRPLRPAALKEQVTRLVTHLRKPAGPGGPGGPADAGDAAGAAGAAGSRDPLAQSRTTDPLARFAPLLARYEESFGETTSGSATTPHETGALDVLGLPLLAHLAVRLLHASPEQDAARLVDNSTSLFRLLTDHTCTSGRYGSVNAVDPLIAPARLRALLQETANAMTAHGSDSISYDELEQRLDHIDGSLLEEVRKRVNAHPISQLVINFFFKGGHTQLGAEFTHKSFREYLAAEGIVEALKAYGREAPAWLPEREPYWIEFDERDPRYAFSRRLAILLSPQWITRDVASHLGHLLEWEIERSRSPRDVSSGGHPTAPITLDAWARVRDGLADLWDWWTQGVPDRGQPKTKGRRLDGLTPAYLEELSEWRLPQHRESGVVPWPSRLTAVNGVLGDGLCRLNAWVHHFMAVRADEEPRWKFLGAEREASLTTKPKRRHQAWGEIHGRAELRFAPSGPDEWRFRRNCRQIQSVGQRPEGSFPSGLDLRSVWLAEMDLNQLAFVDCRLDGACLQSSSIAHTQFYHSNLRFANLRQVGFTGAEFDRSDLSGADLVCASGSSAAFTRCAFDRASLDVVGFRHTSFDLVQFDGASLRDTAFRTCPMYDCSFTDAIFERTIISMQTMDPRSLASLKAASEADTRSAIEASAAGSRYASSKDTRPDATAQN